MHKRFTKKLRAQFLIGTTLAIYKGLLGYWVGDEQYDWLQSPEQYHLTGEEAIQAALGGERPHQVYLVHIKH